MTKSNESIFVGYTPVTALALSYEVYKQQGFVRSGMGYKKYEETYDILGELTTTVKTVNDNRTEVMTLIEKGVQPLPESIERAQQYIDHLNGKMMLRKISNSLTSFEKGLTEAINNDLTKYHVSIIASIPHSEVVDAKRDRLEERMATLKHHSQFFGKQGSRYDLKVEVLDAKYIQSREVYMITTIVDNRDIIKFWWRDQPDICDLIEGKTLNIRGTVNRHEQNKYTKAKETMLNRVSIASI